MPEKTKIIQDISLLFELSLSIGTSLDPQENCYRFLRTLVSRKNLDFGAVWLHQTGSGNDKDCDLFFVYPHFSETQRMIKSFDLVMPELATKPYISISSHDPRFEEIMQEKKVEKGSFAIFRLGDIGFLKVFASNRPNGFTEIEMDQLKQVVDKFKISLDGCFAHLQLKQETENRLIVQQAIRESEEKYRGILENMELGLLEVDLEDNITRANNAFCEMLGYLPSELMGQNASDMFLQESSKKIISERNAERKLGFSSVYEIQMRRKNGELIWGAISGAPIKNGQGQIVGSIGIQFDLTARKKLENELAEAKSTAERARFAERQFLTHMSHEIRTPINAVIGMTHLLYETHPDAVQLDYLDGLRFSADSLLGIIDNILDLSKIDAGEIGFEQKAFDLDYLIKSLLSTLQFKIQEKNLEINQMFDPAIKNLVMGDPTRTNQILTNLVGNALKFTEKGEVSLNTKLLDHSDGYLIELRVHDTGIGIVPDKLETIFEYFKQADVQINRKFGGTGLGLTIVKQLVEMQGGSIRVESELGTGSDFIITLRFGDSGISTTEQGPSYLQSQPNAGNRINGLHFLIVEDNALNQKLLCKTMESWGCTFDVANNGREALKKSAEKRFDMVLMDLHMPELDGFETTMAIRKDPGNPNRDVPIVALTAAAMAEDKKKAFEVGMNGFLTKPVAPKMLQAYLLGIIPNLQPAEPTKPGPMPVPQNKTPELDLSYLLDLSEGDSVFVQQMIDVFLLETADVLEELTVIATQEKWEDVYKLVHTLKPNFSLMGMKDLQQLAQLIEKNIRTGHADSGTIRQQVNKLIRDSKIVLPMLAQYTQRD